MADEQLDRPRKKKWTAAGIAGLLVYSFVCLYAVIPVLLHTALYDSVVMVPTAYDKKMFDTANKIGDVTAEDHFFENDQGDKLHGWLFRSKSSDKVVLYHHGNAGNIATRNSAAAALMQNGPSVFMYDYRGFGRSAGIPSIKDAENDGEAAYNYVNKKLGFDENKIVNYGESIGSGVATIVASNRKCAGLILESPVGSLPQVGRLHFAFLKPYPDLFFPNPKFSDVDQIREVHVPLIIFHGKKDTMIPFTQAEQIFQSANTPKRLVSLNDSGHNSVTSAADYQAYMSGIKDLLSGKL